MKLLLLPLIVFLMIGYFIIIPSYGALPRDHPSLVEISLQYQVRDSEGLLVAYFEPTLSYIIDLASIHEYLDAKENKTTILKEGKSFEIIKWEEGGKFNNSYQYASYDMVYKGKHILAMRHDGFISVPGDTYFVSWKIVRPFS